MVNVFSFCLYGPPNDKYYVGLRHNVLLALRHFPSWRVYVYVAPDVDPEMIQWLRGYHTVVLRETGVLGAPNMIRRFFAIDEPGVDLMMVRDADSRIHWKDRWAIEKFVSSSFDAHTIRDNVEHTAPMMGGLWGIRKSAGLRIQDLYAQYEEDATLGHRLAHDQNFLMDVVYPRVRPRLLVNYSNGRARVAENVMPFPFDWRPDFFCGKTEDVEFIDTPPPRNAVRLSFPQVTVRIR